MILSLLLFIDWSQFRPENIFGKQILERTPAGLTILYIVGLGILLVFLLLTFLDRIRRPKFIAERELPREVTKKLTVSAANRSLRMWQFLFYALAIAVFGFQVYWIFYADEYNEQFAVLSNSRDLRGRRTSAANLRGWMLDRTGKLGASLAYYRIDKDGKIVRYFPLEKEMAHLLGTERGTPGLERTLYKKNIDPMPEAWQVLFAYKKPEPEQKDVRTSIDRDLQTYVAQQLEGKKGAIVVMNPQSGDVYAMYSNPTFDLAQAEDLNSYLKLEADRNQKPLLNRATREYYVPGSTFKTLTMMSAFRAGKQDILLGDLPAPGCYTPYSGSRAICDSGGSCEICQPQVDITNAFKVSSNQYFSHLANELGRDRMAETARLVGILPVDMPKDALTQGFFPDIWNASNRQIGSALAPARSTIVTGKELSLYDFGLEGMGQGLASQMTPFQMALIASTAGNMQGRMMKPKIEADLQPQAFSQVLSPQQGSTVRQIMSTVTEESGGTGGRVKAILTGTGIVVGGKTGTAEKSDAPLYDPKTGERKFVMKKRKNENGEMEDYKEYLSFNRVDGWFICIAPLENPQLAIAVVIEDIGNQFGGGTAAPVAANVILKARELGLLGDQYRPKAPASKQPTQKKKKR
ncbi:MAG: penicillin-binding transpeptidase domain-containing protein [Pyrinomonadaceae bacterium]